MLISRLSSLARIIAVFALLLFAGDIVADGMADLWGGHCVTHSSQEGSNHEQGPCSHCSCATHSGTVIVTEHKISLGAELYSERLLFSTAPGRLPKLAVSIDHPPQLA